MSALQSLAAQFDNQPSALALAEAAVVRNVSELNAVLTTLRSATAARRRFIAAWRASRPWTTPSAASAAHGGLDAEIRDYEALEKRVSIYHQRLLGVADRVLEDARERPWALDLARSIVGEVVDISAETLEALRDIRWKMMAHRAAELPADVAVEVADAGALARLFAPDATGP